MRPWILLAGRFYPRSWRARYGEEFDSLIEDAPATSRQLINVLTGAVRMHWQIKSGFLKLAVALAIVGAIAGAVAGARTSDVYWASAKVKVSVPDFPGANASAGARSLRASNWFDSLFNPTLSFTSLNALVHQLNLYPEFRTNESRVTALRSDLIVVRQHTAAADSSAATADLKFPYPDGRKARLALDEIITGLRAANQEEQQTRQNLWNRYFGPGAQAFPASDFSVLEPVELTRAYLRSRDIFLAAVLGILAGALLALCVFHRTPAVRLVAFAAAGFLVALIPSYWIPNRFESRVTLRLSASQVPAPWPEANLLDETGPAVRWLRSGALIAADPTNSIWATYRLARPGKSAAALMDELWRHIVISGSDAEMHITFTDANRGNARQMLSWMSNALENWSTEGNRARCRDLGGANCRIFEYRLGQQLEITSPPSIPEAPVAPNRLLIALGGLTLGLAFGAFRLWRGGAATPAPQPNGPDSLWGRAIRRVTDEGVRRFQRSTVNHSATPPPQSRYATRAAAPAASMPTTRAAAADA